ncbi:MAG: SRPBCC domain-containing protein [Solirubrobacteraceae bacterium]
MVELDQGFETDKPIDATWGLVLDLERLVPCVQGGKVLDKTSDDEVKAEIRVKMGAMSMRFNGTVTVVQRDDEAHSALLRVKSREVGGSGHANADVTFTLRGGNIHTAAQITGKAASMGEGTVATVLEALVKDFTERFEAAA